MSYYIGLEVDLGGKNPVVLFEPVSITSNLSKMFFWATEDIWSFQDLNNLRAETAQKILVGAITRLIELPKEANDLAPKNGWGTRKGLIKTLETLLEDCGEAPKATLFVHY